MLSFDEFVGNVCLAVHGATCRRPDIARAFLALVGHNLHGCNIMVFGSLSVKEAIVTDLAAYAELAEATMREFMDEMQDSYYLASTFPVRCNTPGGQEGIADLVVAACCAGDAQYCLVLRQLVYDAGQLAPGEVPDFGRVEERILRRYLGGAVPNVIAMQWPGFGIIPVDVQL